LTRRFAGEERIGAGEKRSDALANRHVDFADLIDLFRDLSRDKKNRTVFTKKRLDDERNIDDL
jgi:hypothetical protein